MKAPERTDKGLRQKSGRVYPRKVGARVRLGVSGRGEAGLRDVIKGKLPHLEIGARRKYTNITKIPVNYFETKSVSNLM